MERHFGCILHEIKAVFTGKLDGDTIKGTIALNINGEDRTLEWVAKRAK